MYRNCAEMPEIEHVMRHGCMYTGKKLSCGECGTELVRGEKAFLWAGPLGREMLVCRQCFCELFDELSVEEKATLAGSEMVVIGAPVGLN